MKRLFVSSIAFFSVLGCLMAQNVSDLIISEVLPEPDSTGILDAYGRRSGWIEIFNTSQGTVNFGGCFLTDDPQDLKKSPIPKGDFKTKLGPRQTALFFATGNNSEGTFYSGLVLSPGKTVYLVSNDGRTIIDSLSVPSDLPYGYSARKEAHDLKSMVFELIPEPAIPSPGIPNTDPNAQTKAQVMAVRDPHGWTLTVVSISVVFCALAILWGLFILLFRILAASDKAPVKKPVAAKKASGTPDSEVAAAIACALDMECSGEDYAAIAAAVHLYLSDMVHDEETYIITINRKDSTWNEKSSMFRRLPSKE